MAATQPTLADQIRAQGGDWHIRGIDRAQELADILAKNGITDLSQLRMNHGTIDQYYGQGGDAGEVRQDPNNTMSYGDRTFGTLAREGGTSGANMTNTEGGDILARSVAGKGAVIYRAIPGPDGRVSIQPTWQSSGEEDAAKAIAKWAATVGSMGTLGGMGMLGDSALAASQGTIFGGMGGAGSGIGSLAGNADKAALFGDLGYGAGMTGAETAAFDAALAGGTGGVGSGVGALAGNADKAALFGNSGYGAGMTGAETAAYDAALGGAAPTLNPADYSHEGLNYPTSASTQPGGPLGGAPGSVTSGIPSLNMSDPSLLSKFGDWAAANPKLAAQLAGIAGGALFGDKNKDTGTGGGTGANPQAGFTATAPAATQRQYYAPPPGYRPGIDPEFNYFTGVGALGTSPVQPSSMESDMRRKNTQYQNSFSPLNTGVGTIPALQQAAPQQATGINPYLAGALQPEQSMQDWTQRIADARSAEVAAGVKAINNKYGVSQNTPMMGDGSGRWGYRINGQFVPASAEDVRYLKGNEMAAQHQQATGMQPQQGLQGLKIG